MSGTAAPALIGAHFLQLLAAGSFSQSFTPERSYTSLIDAEELEALRVNVVAWTTAEKPRTRSEMSLLVTLNVEVAQQIDPLDVSRCDALAYLIEELGGYVSQAPLPAGVQLVPPDEDNPLYAPQFDPEMLAASGVFFGVLSVRYLVPRGTGG